MAKYSKDSSGKYVFDRRIDGKRCHIRGDTIAEVDKKLKAWQDAREKEKEEQGRAPLFEKIAPEWYAKASPSLAYSTANMYKIRLNALLEEFTGYRMDEITPLEVSRCYERMAAKGYAKKTITHARTVLRNVYDYWNLEYNQSYNPITYAKITKGKSSKERTPPPDAAVAAVKEHSDGFGILPMLLMYTGMRLSEAMGLQKRDIDLSNSVYGCKGSITISKEIKWDSSGRPYEKVPKTEAGIRIVPILTPLYATISDAVAGLKAEDYIISRSSTQYDMSAFNRRWAKYCREIGFAQESKVPGIRHGKEYQITQWKASITPHQFRHLMATACFEAGIPELVAQKILGHKDIATTHKVYTHVRDRLLEKSYADLDMVAQKI